ncbi:MAG: hypothetical protein ABEI99_02060 [Halobaculum sp.]
MSDDDRFAGKVALATATVERFGRLEVAVANAGTGETRDVPISELPVEQF